MSTPLTQIHICSGVRLDNRYQHTIYFASPEAQQDYFAGKVVRTFPAYSHHRRNWELKVEATVATAQNWNYLYVINPGVKPHYYFINKVEYVSDTTVKLYLELDVVQTNLFEMQLLPCFVERQHTTSDTPGEHTIPEGLEIGPYCNYHVYNLEDMASMGILVLSALELGVGVNEETPSAYARNFDGVFSGLSVYAFDSIKKLEQVLNKLDSIGKAQAIVSIWMYPKNLVRLGVSSTLQASWSEVDWTSMECYPVYGVESIDVKVSHHFNYYDKIFQGYNPRNNKLYTYPYNMLYVTSNQGDKAEYRFEYFNEEANGCPFRLYGAISPDAGVKLVPDYYNTPGANSNYDEGITLGNFPPCAWDSDTYKVWLAQNYNQLGHGVQTGVVTGITGLATAITGIASGNIAAAGSGASMSYSGFNQVSGIMAQVKDMEAQPPQARGAFSSTVNVASKRQTFTFYYKSIREEYARQVDDYFTMYGYKVQRVQVPNINARPGFTFVKTVGCKVHGNLNNDDIATIERIFDNGITFWKNGNNIGDYHIYNAV